eukprot:7120875-Pyramimonas_sp.AAC.1
MSPTSPMDMCPQIQRKLCKRELKGKARFVTCCTINYLAMPNYLMTQEVCEPVFRLGKKLSTQLLAPCLLLDAPFVLAVIASHSN